MYYDQYGTRKGQARLKINLHTHTTNSDGRKSPEEVARIYKERGYDAVAFTDHWVHGKEQVIEGLLVLAGCEFNLNYAFGEWHVSHIVGVGFNEMPDNFDYSDRDNVSPQDIIDGIKAKDGFVIWAHPAWSLNSAEYLARLEGYDATEIYNTVSGVHNSSRPYSGLIVDMLATEGVYCGLVADDDTHYYDGEECRSYIMLACDICDRDHIMQALRAGDYYATQGPELHMRVEDGRAIVDCSPCCRIAFFSNAVYTNDRVFRGEGLTHAEYEIKKGERFIRVEVTDEDGNEAWSNIIKV